MSMQTAKRYQIVGWLLYILCAALFIWSTASAGDMVGLSASIVFLIACFVFLIPVLRTLNEEVAR